jgi:hypothetical protein
MNYTTTAPDRRTLVKAIAEHLELAPTYDGPPRFSYSVGDITIERDGTVVVEDERTAARLRAFLMDKGWMESEPETHAAEAEPDLEEPVMDIGCPLSEMTVLSLTNLIHMLYSKQYILAKSVRKECIAITAEVITELREHTPQTVEEMCERIRNLTALGHLKGIRVTDETVFITFPLTEDETARAAFQQLGVSIYNFAKAAKRVQPDFVKPEAEKYHMRGWLLRLGFGGSANATARKVLLEHLAGCSAFPSAEQAKRHADKYAAIRKAQREAARAAAEALVAASTPIQEPVTAAETAPAERPVKPDVKEAPSLE